MKTIVSTAKAPAAIGPYSQGIIMNGMVYVSGQLPVDPATGLLVEGIENQTRQALDNVSAILEAAGSSLEQVAKVTVYLSDISDFAAVNAVYAEYFTVNPPARVCLQAAALPKAALIEIDAIAGIGE